ncbi:PolC-type DNA polymerase III [Ilyobacter polytropus]|uniref:DNA polymerase III PolC-type n=1 Tax=Ilyobacter polytropus (strain ATCC 51220 / DSM 2926 / LMG 16218 / CuHBu1) TaxID=572544 RepID=E3H9Y2_ILYPC|nr:PolC-type DNA polymerase III [Ilyobacter polytropus]ADO83110.1 DNA polymerase III, alpha subunit [Ilyobacter polytropus DSM 2926]
MYKNKVKIKPRRNIFESIGVKNIDITEIVVYEREKKIELNCLVSTTASLRELDILENSLADKFGQEADFHFELEFLNKEITRDDLKEIIERIIREIKRKNAISRSFLYLYRISIQNEHIDIELKNETAVDILLESSIHEKLNHRLKRYGIRNFEVRLVSGDFTKELKEVDNSIINIEKELEKKISSEEAKVTSVKKAAPVTTSKSGDVVIGKIIKGKTISFEAFSEIYDGESCVLEGQLFSIEKRDLKSGKVLVTFNITNLENSVSCKKFMEKAESEKLSIKENIWVKLNGKKQRDKYSNDEEILMVGSINIIDSKTTEREDRAAEKMVELHTHTKMSDMVGSIDAKNLVKRALKYGHKALAVTDYGGVHSFPFVYKAAKGSDLKVIFGCDAYMVDDSRPMVENPKDVLIQDETYVVYDLETMGLNSHENEIIEIGAIKLKGTRIVDKYSQLINPGKSIPSKIQELTGITDDMVKDEPSIEEVLPGFLEFAGDATLVAHNARFDIGFLTRDVKKYTNIKDYKPSVIDTLQWARDLLPDLRGYGLKSVTKKLGVALENHHRAVDDSQATAHMFAIFLEKFIEEGAVKLNELDKVFPVNIKKQDTSNVMLLVKNNTGLKNLYKLVSEAHINYYGSKKPRIPRSIIEENREGIIIGAAMSMHFGNEGELASAYFRYNLDCIDEKINFYDYIELQPRETYTELYEKEGTGTISSFDNIEKANKSLYKLAKSKGKKVIATSNVHYLDEEDHRVRSILLYGSGSVFREKQYNSDNKFYFRSTNEMLREFSYLGEDVAREIVIESTNAIADEVEKIQPVPSGFFPPKIDNAEEIVKEMTYNKAYKIYGNPLPEIVAQRLERELKAIVGNGFSVLYLSAQKLVKESLDNGYLVGSRGSVGSSLVAFMMDITEVNALYPHYICVDENCRYSEFMDKEGAGVDLPDKICPKCGKELKKEGHAIPFEVFMGFNGDKVPDIDLNFSGEYQSEIHRYCERLFGKENVFKAGTISTLAEKNAYGYVKKYFEEHNISVRNAEIIRLAKKCEGAKKTTGQHPGGMIVVPQGHSIYEFCPVQKPANDAKNESITTHFDYHVMDEQLVKLDILGHDDPTTIKLLQEYTGVDIYDVPLADPETLKIFSGTESLGVTPDQINSVIGTYGVPEFGTQFVRQMLVDTMPTTFAELVRISGLSHGTDVWLNNAQEFVRKGEATLSEIISVRDDIMNYLIDSGIEKGTAFKIMEFVRKGRPSKEADAWKDYSKLMKEHNVPDWYIESCRRIKYMFPKGHAVAYVTMAMRIAYFKVHHPLAFYAAYLSRKADDFDSEFMLSLNSVKEKIDELSKEMKLDVRQKSQLAVSEIILEMHARGFEFLGIDIYKSDGFKFTIEDDKIRIPLVALNGLGGAVVENVIKEREIGKFLSYEDLKRRTKASQTVIEKLKIVNAIDGLSDTNQKSLF